MDLCLMIEGQEGVTWPQWQALATACERHGIPALFRSDHYLNLDGQHLERGALDAWGTINALAAITSTLRLGTLVSPASFRHPSVLAKLVVTADHVSQGRIELGIGAGWHEREHEAYGFPFARTAVRMDVLEEQLRVLIGHWGSEPFSLDGEHYVLSELDARPKPVQQPHPPLIMGGIAGPRSAALAARFADEYNTPFPSLDEARERRAQIAKACERAGRDLIPFSAMIGTVLGADAADLEDRARRVAERTGRSADSLVREPPSGWIVATIEQAAEQFAAYRDAGLRRVMCQSLVHDDLDAVALIGELGRQLS
ncbi:MAG TPA: LLM class flavin-dependent oxidoreductase [Solirubrobacteraceae bacterium]|jgi:alkanesulfonate monooxygenase SsuD/methylene tetrahydromethanopterin reductase-like flavin-dependent oxidoreductase (luciferase family)